MRRYFPGIVTDEYQVISRILSGIQEGLEPAKAYEPFAAATKGLWWDVATLEGTRRDIATYRK
jgi:hypothetical protein